MFTEGGLVVSFCKSRNLWLVLLLALAFSCGGKKTKAPKPVARPAPSQTAPSQTAPSQTAPAGAFQGAVPDAPSRPAVPVGSGGAGPIVRIGLDTAAREVRVSSSEGFYVADKDSENSRLPVRGEVRIRIGAEPAAAAPVYQIQVASLASAKNAGELRERLAGELGLPATVWTNPGSGANQVRVGAFATKEAAQDYLPNLRGGYPDAFVVLHEAGDGKKRGKKDDGRAALSLTGADGLSLSSRTGFLVFPGGAEFLRVGGDAYRGSLDVFLNKSKQITLVNQLPLEDYLLGVVPAEMSPSHFPEFAALAAQAVAARTYALKNIGRFRSDGFDLTDDTRTQVYGGVKMEKAMSSEIVRQTAGVAVYYDGQPIDAMYMASCGGRTEDFELVFGTKPVPYLKSVACPAEAGPDEADAQDAAGGRRVAATWSVTFSRDAMAEKLRGLVGDLGGLLDLQPALLGQSGRLVRIQAVGARKSAEVKGYRLRGALGLRDTPLDLSRELGEDGEVASFTFSGRGAGHGIGLCQTGAFRMARAGSSYEDILKTYYTGVDIRNAY